MINFLRISGFWKQKIFGFSQILVLESWAKRRDYQWQKEQKLLLYVKKGTQKDKFKKLKLGKTAIHLAIAKFQNFVSFQVLHGSEVPGLLPKGMIT